MLHGELKVNGGLIGHWSARRLKPLKAGQDLYDYEFEVMVPSADQHHIVTSKGRVRHRYSQGAAALASKVLKAASVDG